MALVRSRKLKAEPVSRDEAIDTISSIIGNKECTYGLQQFIGNPSVMGAVATDIYKLSSMLSRIRGNLYKNSYTPSKFSEDLDIAIVKADSLYAKCADEKSMDYAYSNRYHNDAENPWTGISAFLYSSIGILRTLSERTKASPFKE
jgi:hypothetical protein